MERGDREEISAMLGVEGELAGSVGDLLSGLETWHRRRKSRGAVDGWLHRPTWIPVSGSPNELPSGHWLAVTPSDDAWSDAVLDGLVDAGMRIERLTVSAAEAPESFAGRIADALAEPTAGVLSLLAVDEAPHDQHPLIPRGLAETFALAKAMVAADADTPLWCLTRGAVAVEPAENLSGPTQAQVWGLGRVIAMEQGQLWGGLVDLPAEAEAESGADRDTAARLAGVLTGGHGDQIAIRTSGVYARRLTRTAAGSGGAAPKIRGTVLVTGGLGGLGGHVAPLAPRLGRRRTPRARRPTRCRCPRRGRAARGTRGARRAGQPRRLRRRRP